MSDRVFYLDVVGDSFLGRLARKARADMYEIFLRELQPTETTTVLDVGVSVVEENPEESNILERRYPYPTNLTMLGIHDGAFLEQQFPGARYVRYHPSSPFPFHDREFDVCYCNAVLEHVGEARERRQFVRELLRVGRKVFLSTPNRWYPLDFHKMIPFLHWLPQDWYRRVLRAIGDDFYSQKANLDLLSRRDLERLLREAGARFRILPYRFGGLVSNLLVVAERG